MFTPVTAKVLNQPQNTTDPDFLKYLREEADCLNAGGNENGEVCEEEAKACIRDAQEELNAFINERGKTIKWYYPKGDSNEFKLSEAVVDDKMTQQETADYFKMKAAKYSHQFQQVMSWTNPAIVDGVLVSSSPKGLDEMRRLYKKLNDYIYVGESLSNGTDNRILARTT